MKYLQIKKIVQIVSGTLFSLLLFAIPSVARAEWWNPFSWIEDFVVASTVGILLTVLQAISYLISIICGFILSFFGILVTFAVELNFQILSEANTLVHVGWGIVRDIANLGFVLVIIVIAIATILRIEKFQAKQLLPKLIAAAILVNFSFALAGVFVDFSNVLTHFFFNKTQHPWDIGTSLGGAFGPQRLMNSGLNQMNMSDVGTTLSASFITSLVGIVFTIIFTVIAIIVVAAFGILLLVRFMQITFLVIIFPIVWLFWVIPSLASYMNQWWSAFIKWIFFAPAMAMFLYIALTAVEELSNSAFLTPKGANVIEGTLLTIFMQGMQMIVLCGFLIGGLIAAQKMGIEGAGAALKLAKAGKTKVQGWAKSKALTAGRDTEGRTALERFGAGKAGRMPLVGRAVTALSERSTREKMARAGNEKKAQDQYMQEDEGQLINGVKPGQFRNDDELAQRGVAIAKRGFWNKLSPEEQQRIIQALQKTKSTKNFEEVLKVDPTLASQFGETVEKWIPKVEKIDKLDPAVIKKYAAFITDAQASILEEMQGAAGTAARKALVDGKMTARGTYGPQYDIYRELQEQISEQIEVSQIAYDKIPQNDVSARDAQKIKIATEKEQLAKNKKLQEDLMKPPYMTASEKRATVQYDRLTQKPGYADVIP